MRLASTLTALFSALFLTSLVACASAQKPVTDDGVDPGASSRTETSVEAGTTAATPGDAAGLLMNGRMAAADLLVGGQPTRAQIEALHGKGYTTMITLQTSGEEEVPETLAHGRAAFGDAGVVHLPVQGQPGVTAENAALLGTALAEARARGGKIVLHCRSGQRAAALYGLARHQLDGLSAEETLKEAEAAGLTDASMRDHLAELLAE